MSLVASISEICSDIKGRLSSNERWSRIELGNVVAILNGYPFKSTLFNSEKGYPIIRIRDISNSATNTYYSGIVPSEYIIKKGDLLIGMDGNFRCVEWKGVKAGLNQRVCKITPDERLLVKNFLLYGIGGYLSAIEAATSSVTVCHLSSRDIQRIPFPLPPLGEQKRIVEKLDTILPKVKSAKTRLENIPGILKKFRQSVLAAACSGRLTEDWREGNPDVEDANSIYTRTRVFNKTADVAFQENDIGWFIAKAEYVTSTITKGTTPKAGELLSDGLIPYLKVYNIVDQSIDFNYKPQFVSAETHRGLLQRSIIYPGDVLMNIVGPPLGKVAITPNNYEEWNINQAIAFFRPIKELLTSDYLYIVLCNGEPIQEISKEFRGSAGQQNISLEQARNFLMPLPPLQEQHEIVRRVEKLFALADSLETKYKKAMERVEKIEQSVLAKAFRGELVEPDSNDEPAEELLKRILAEKAKLEGGKKMRKKKSEGR
jgi:type I restriction enzyme, S subunit